MNRRVFMKQTVFPAIITGLSASTAVSYTHLTLPTILLV